MEMSTFDSFGSRPDISVNKYIPTVFNIRLVPEVRK